MNREWVFGIWLTILSLLLLVATYLMNDARSDLRTSMGRVDSVISDQAKLTGDVSRTAVHVEYLRKQADALNEVATELRVTVQGLSEGQQTIAAKLDEIQSDIKKASLKQAMPAWAGFKYQIMTDPESAMSKLKSINASTKGMFDAGGGKWMMMYGETPGNIKSLGADKN
ncbi:MAG: TolA-binding protein [Paracoccaceae bacterium]